jgi:predicted nucleotidyltransferase
LLLRPSIEGTFTVKVIKPEDIIGLKVQSSSNDPKRHDRDMDDIEQLLKLNKGNLDFQLIREYFFVFEREKEFDTLLEKIDHA